MQKIVSSTNQVTHASKTPLLRRREVADRCLIFQRSPTRLISSKKSRNEVVSLAVKVPLSCERDVWIKMFFAKCWILIYWQKQGDDDETTKLPAKGKNYGDSKLKQFASNYILRRWVSWQHRHTCDRKEKTEKPRSPLVSAVEVYELCSAECVILQLCFMSISSYVRLLCSVNSVTQLGVNIFDLCDYRCRVKAVYSVLESPLHSSNFE